MEALKANGIENILALRGDIVAGNENREKWDFESKIIANKDYI